MSTGAETSEGICIGLGNEQSSSDIRHKSREMSTGAKTFEGICIGIGNEQVAETFDTNQEK